MEATRTVKWETKDGRQAEVTITKTRTVRDNISYADGWNVNLGKETVERLEVVLKVNGREVTEDNHKPIVVTKKNYSPQGYEKIKAAGGYAQLGKAYIDEERYNLVMAAIAEADAEAAGSEEYAAVKSAEMEKEARKEAKLQAEAEEYARLVKSGLCPKCQSWCYGDCTASQQY